jgi:hypothetical protein
MLVARSFGEKLAANFYNHQHFHGLEFRAGGEFYA